MFYNRDFNNVVWKNFSQKKNRPIKGGVSSFRELLRVHNLNFCARDSFPGEGANLARDEFHHSVATCVDSKVAAHVSASASDFSCANLTNNYLSLANFLATKSLDTKTMTGVIMDIFGGTARFHV